MKEIVRRKFVNKSCEWIFLTTFLKKICIGKLGNRVLWKANKRIGINVANKICEVLNRILKFLKGGVTEQEKNYVTVRWW